MPADLTFILTRLGLPSSYASRTSALWYCGDHVGVDSTSAMTSRISSGLASITTSRESLVAMARPYLVYLCRHGALGAGGARTHQGHTGPLQLGRRLATARRAR